MLPGAAITATASFASAFDGFFCSFLGCCCCCLQAKKQFKSLYNLFIGTDATQVEINPLAVGSIPGGEQGLGESSSLAGPCVRPSP